MMLIRAYRIRGHLIADLDPLGMRDTKVHPELDPASYGFTEADMDRRSSSITCWGWKSPACARSSISSGAPTAAHLPCNTCTSRIRTGRLAERAD